MGIKGASIFLEFIYPISGRPSLVHGSINKICCSSGQIVGGILYSLTKVKELGVANIVAILIHLGFPLI